MKLIALMLISASLFAQYPDVKVHETNECAAISDKLYDENWVLMHHIDYGHDAETKVSIGKVRDILKEYDSKCSSNKGAAYKHADVQYMLQKLDKIEKTYRRSKYFGINKP